MPTAQSQVFVLQNAATANGNGTPQEVDGFLSAQAVEIAETGGGTCTLNLEGSFDGANWYAIGFQQVDGQAALTRSVSAISVTANSRHVYQLLDPYSDVRTRISSVAGGATVTAKLYAVA